MKPSNHPKVVPYRCLLPQGRILRRVLRDDPNQEYLAYVPTAGAAGRPVLVSVHGISRNAHEQAIMFAPYCERFGVVLVVPRFTREQHSDYQRLGRRGRGQRADRVLDKCLAEVALLTGADVTQFSLFGYSGGAQFAHRYLMAHPHRLMKAVLVAAGWYTFPDHRQRYPYGIRPSRKLEGVSFNPEEFLRVPVHVLVGENDLTTANLRQTDRCNKQQGVNRVERAGNWVAAMCDAADEYDLEHNAKLTVVPGTDHSFTRFCKRGALVRRVFKSLFDVSIEPRDKSVQALLDRLDTNAERLLSSHQQEAQVVIGRRNST